MIATQAAVGTSGCKPRVQHSSHCCAEHTEPINTQLEADAVTQGGCSFKTPN